MTNINKYAEDLVLDFADSVHAELTQILKKQFGDDWLSQGVRKHFKDEQFVRVERMLQNPMRVVEMNKTAEEIHGLEHFWQIIGGNWSLFGNMFEDKRRTEVYLQEIAELRHNLAHRMKRHVLLKGDLIRIVGNCRMVLSALGSPLADRFTEVIDSLIAGGTPWGPALGGHLPPSDEIYAEFVGRPGELNDLSDWLASDRSQILVWGYGGAGKSALTHKFARDVKEGSRDGLIAVCWVSAKRSEYIEGTVKNRPADFFDMQSLVRAIWSALYGAEDIQENLEASTLISQLREMPTLLVVDDFDTVSGQEDVSEFLIHDLRDTPTRVIYTSRQRVIGTRHLEVPAFTDFELREFVSLRATEYGADKAMCLQRANGIMRVTDGVPLFIDDLIHHAALVGVKEALENWSQKKGDAAREYALRRQVEYLGQSSAEVLIALSIANRSLLPVEISNIAGLTDGDAQGGLTELLQWRMVNQVIEDESSSPAYRMNANTSRLVQQTYRDDARMRTYSAAFKALTGERVPEAKRLAIGKIINRTKELSRTSFETSRDFLVGSMTGELAESSDLFGVLGWLYSNHEPIEEYAELAKEAFGRSHSLGSAKVDTYYHWALLEQNIAESMINNAADLGIPEDKIGDQWKACEAVIEGGLDRCGPSQPLCYKAGYAASREAKSRERTNQFSHAQGAYTRSIDWFSRALDAPVSDVASVNKGAIYRGLTLSYEGLGDEEELRKTLQKWFRFSGAIQYFETEYLRLLRKFPSLRDIPEFQYLRAAGATNFLN